MNAENRENSTSALHGILFFSILMTVTFAVPTLLWPWNLIVPVGVYGGTVVLVGPLRRTAPALSIGQMTGRPLAFAAVVAVGAPAVLVLFHLLKQPDVRHLADRLPVAWFSNLVLAGACFSIANPILEELIFRGVFWEVVATEWNGAVALGVTAFLFGIGHMDGYPPGVIGAVLAGLYGLALGVLRWWTGGLGLGILCHIGADATIFGVLYHSAAFETVT